MKTVVLSLCILAGLGTKKNETGGQGQPIDPGPKKNDYTLAYDTGGVKVPPDGKKLDFYHDTGGTLPAGPGGKKVNNW